MDIVVESTKSPVQMNKILYDGTELSSIISTRYHSLMLCYTSVTS